MTICKLDMYELKLYVAGQTPKSLAVIEELTRLLEDELDVSYNLEVVDVIDSPGQAERAKVLATPTLEKVSPEPVKKIVGDVSGKKTTLSALGLTPQEENKR